MEALKLSNNTAKLHEMFGKNLYTSKYSWISEVCQNAVDSHRMAGVKEPVVIGLRYDKKKTNYVFFVKDIGLSFTDVDDFKKKIGTLLESGKSQEKNNDEDCPMGMHGIGSIAVSAFHNEWFYTVVTPTKEKFKVRMLEIEDKGLNLEVTNLGKTKDAKGVLFEVEVEMYTLSQLINEMKSKLAYFKDIQFDFDETVVKVYNNLLTLNTDFKLYEAEHFQVSSLSTERELHICLDQYTYPIKWAALGISTIPLNIGLKFKMGDGLEANITRESLKVTDQYAGIIKDKLAKVATDIVERYNETVPDSYTSVKLMVEALATSKTIQIGSKLFDVERIAKYSTVKLKKIKFKDVTEDNFSCFTRYLDKGEGVLQQRFEISQNGKKLTKDKGSSHWGQPYKHKIFVDKPIPSRTMAYLREKYRYSGLYYPKNIRIFSNLKTVSLESIYALGRKIFTLTYKNSGVNLWRDTFDQHKLLVEASIKDYYIRASDIKVPKDWNTQPKKTVIRKEKISLEDMRGEIGIKSAHQAKAGSYLCKFVEKVTQVKDLHKLPKFHVYGTLEDREKLELVWSLLPLKTNIDVCVIGINSHNAIKKLNLHNFMNVEEFLKGKHKSFRRMMTGYIIETELMDKHSSIFDAREVIGKYISTAIDKDMAELEDYVRKNSFSSSTRIDECDMQPLLEITHDLKLYDLTIWGKYEKMSKVVGNLDYVSYFSDAIMFDHNDKEVVLRILKDVTRQRKIKMDWQNYLIKDDEE